MAESYSHKFGQIIGGLLENAIEPHLIKFARKHRLYLDKKGARSSRKGKKVSWTDGKGNRHDLDYVLERGGTKIKTGNPVAFIEIAWRRYTKHSRNKAQEIQSAILPLAEAYRNSSPFVGVILAGEFTQGALTQLKSLGFTVLHFSYSSVVQAFSKFGIDAHFNENTLELEFKQKIESYKSLPDPSAIAKELLRLNKSQVTEFFNTLSLRVSRFVEQVWVLPLYGKETCLNSINEAIEHLTEYNTSNVALPLIRYEIIIRYNTGEKIEASFQNRVNAIEFLRRYT